MLLGARLLCDGLIDLDQLEAALRAQLRFGGRLGAHLVDAGALSLDVLATVLGELAGVPVASQAELDDAAPRAIASLPPELLRRHVAFPLALTDGPPRQLLCALADPHDADAVAQLALASGCHIATRIAPELRLRAMIDRTHGRDPQAGRSAGFVATAAPPTTLLPRSGSGTLPPPSLRQPSRSRPETTPPPPMQALPRLTMTEAMARLQQATSRDQIADTLLQFAGGRAGAALLFLLREHAAAGWRSAVPALPDGVFAKLTLQLPTGCLLARACATRAPVRGRRGDSDGDTPLLAALAVGPAPPDALVVPIVVGSRVVNLLAVAGAGGAPLEDAAAEAVVAIAAGAEQAYWRILQAQKHR